MALPRYATVVESSEFTNVDEANFFNQVSNLDVRNEDNFQKFMNQFKNIRIKVVGISDSLRFCDVIPASPEFDQFSVDLWKQYYVQEDIRQIGLLEDKQPVEGLFVGGNSGRVYVCAQADDFSQQKVVCVAPSLHKLVWRGPQSPVEYNSGCMFDNCYGCLDPVIRRRMFRFKHF